MATIRFPLEVGMLNRGPVRRELKSYCYGKGYEILIKEDRGLLESLFLVRIEVPSQDADQVVRDIQRWVKDNE